MRPPLPPEIAESRLIAIARRVPHAAWPGTAAALESAGVTVVEITLDDDAALDMIADHEGVVGAGTVLTMADAADAVAAGATFLVSPHLDPDIVRWAVGREVAIIPGALTPTEVVAAWRLGASAVKLFPASAGGPGLLRAIRGPLPAIPLIPTGGVSIDNARDYLAAGALAVGVGGWLTAGHSAEVVAQRAGHLMKVVHPR